MSNNDNVRRASSLISQAVQLLNAEAPSPQPSTPNNTIAVQVQPANSSESGSRIASTPSSSRSFEERSSVLSELRRNFQPYERSDRRRLAGRTAQDQEWSHRFYCLDSPDVARTPLRRHSTQLIASGLGLSMVVAKRSSSSVQLSDCIRQVFPALSNTEFELLQSAGGGGGQGKPLRRISMQHKIPSVSMLLQTRVQSIIYIRPLSPIQLGESDDDTTRVDNFQSDSQTGNGSAGSESALDLNVISKQHTPNTNDDVNLEDNGAAGEIVTVEEFRVIIYSQNPGIQLIAVQRDEFALQVLGIYKDPLFNIKQQPQVVFVGEPGRDVGALTKEFFWKGIDTIRTATINGLPLLEGEDDHKLPASDVSLLRSGFFSALGKFIGHAALHSGLGFFGLSAAVVDYLCSEDLTPDTPISMDAKDIPYLKPRSAVEIIQRWTRGVDPDAEAYDIMRQSAQDAGFNETITFTNRLFLKQQLLHHFVIEKRRQQLDDMKSGFMQSPVSKYLCQRSYLHQS